MSKLAKALTAAAGNAGAGALYAEDVFSTYLYQGTGTAQTITNGIDLAGEGGLVWVKARNFISPHSLADTERGRGSWLDSSSSSAAGTPTATEWFTSFNSDGFSLGDNWQNENRSGIDTCSWTFRKAEKFFDVVTYTGNGSTTYAHSLNAIPAFVLYKATSTTSSWLACTRKNDGSYVVNILNGTTGTIFSYADADAMGLTETTFNPDPTGASSVGTEYVAYLFASDAGGFGDDGSENIIKCGSYTGNGTSSNYIDFGFEPQWLLVKNATTGGTPWLMLDNMRGWPAAPASAQQELIANGPNAESTGSNVGITSTGIGITTSATPINASGNTYIYIAIRRPMKTPESGTEVFAAAFGNDSGSSPPTFSSGFTPDAVVGMWPPASWNGAQWFSRLTGNKRLISSGTAVEGTQTEAQWDYMDGAFDWSNLTTYFAWMFKRATGFFDVVAYTGDGVAGRTVAHSLGVAPELVIMKSRSNARNWVVYHAAEGNGREIVLNLVNSSKLNAGMFNNTSPTSNQLTLGNDASVNGSTWTFVAYLFATLAGVSKVGSYTGTGSNVDVDCGFSAGARFILIKRTDSTGDWYVWDSVRGIVAGNDPYLLLNSTAAENTSTDYIDPLSSGFTVTSSAPAALNASGGNYIFLAIA